MQQHNQKGKKESKIRSGDYYGKKNHLQEHILPHIALYKLDVKNGLNQLSNAKVNYMSEDTGVLLHCSLVLVAGTLVPECPEQLGLSCVAQTSMPMLPASDCSLYGTVALH